MVHASEVLTAASLLLNAALWAAISAETAAVVPGLLDPRFRAHGFCAGRAETDGVNSFEACFYEDVIGAAVLWLLARNVLSTAGYQQQTLKALPGMVLHGIVHYYQHVTKWPDHDVADMSHNTDLKMLAFMVPFTASFLHSVGVGAVWGRGGLAAATLAIVGFQIAFVPPLFALNYVNTWIMLSANAVMMTRGLGRPRDAGDTLTSALLLAVLSEPLLEAFWCDGGLVRWGGHALFDGGLVLLELTRLATNRLRETGALGSARELKLE